MDPREQELGMLAYLVREPAFLVGLGRGLKDYHFTYATAKPLFGLIHGVAVKYKRAPTFWEAERAIVDLSTTQSWSLTQREVVLEDLTWVYQTTPSGLTGEKIHTWYVDRQRQRIGQKILSCPPGEISKSVPEIRAELNELVEDVREREEVGLFPFSQEGLEVALDEQQDRYTGAYMPTGFARLDKRLLGGLQPEELTIFLAGINVGKTMFLINLAWQVLCAGYRVVYYALDNPQADIIERLFALVSNKDVSPAYTRVERRRDVLIGLGGMLNERLCIRKWPPNRKRVSDVQTHIRRVRELHYEADLAAGIPEAKAGKVDLAILDYGALFIPEVRQKERRFELTDNCREMVAIATEEKMQFVTTLQLNRPGMKAKNPEMWDIGEAISQCEPAAHIGALAQTRPERREGIMRLNMIKARRSDLAGMCLHLRTNTRRQKIWEDPDYPDLEWIPEEEPVDSYSQSAGAVKAAAAANKGKSSIPGFKRSAADIAADMAACAAAGVPMGAMDAIDPADYPGAPPNPFGIRLDQQPGVNGAG